jgi:hypothetical protein
MKYYLQNIIYQDTLSQDQSPPNASSFLGSFEILPPSSLQRPVVSTFFDAKHIIYQIYIQALAQNDFVTEKFVFECSSKPFEATSLAFEADSLDLEA